MKTIRLLAALLLATSAVYAQRPYPNQQQTDQVGPVALIAPSGNPPTGNAWTPRALLVDPTTGALRVTDTSASSTAIGATTDTPSTAVEDATARTSISLLKGIKNYLRDLAANIAVASGATDAGNPLKVGGRYNATPPTLSDGQRADLQLDSRGNVRTMLVGANSVNVVQAATAQDGLANGLGLYMVPLIEYFNGTNWDRVRNNTSTVLLASAARTTTQTSADITNYNARGLQVILDVTSAGTGNVTLSIQGKDANNVYYTLLTGAAVSSNSTNVYHLGPEITAVANQAVNLYVPRTFRIVITANNANSMTYSAAYNLNL